MPDKRTTWLISALALFGTVLINQHSVLRKERAGVRTDVRKVYERMDAVANKVNEIDERLEAITAELERTGGDPEGSSTGREDRTTAR